MKPLFLLVCVLLASSFFIPISTMPIQDQPLGGEHKGNKLCGRGIKCKPPRKCKGNNPYCRPP
ncbi:hypothetical protein E1A91_D11G329700v1 [Gossypium mustelinum]|uniref:Uncharacterized protein n=1 Tax=Gossypium mustelinum TaxID=34275 RepID=A0A5D2T1W2_GOSMU|nr:hypothetical protein E1A91_D11G329700v1 [Gossypium mustelinum]